MADLRTALKFQAQALRAQADAIDALADSLSGGGETDALLDAKQSLSKYGLGHEAVRAAAERGELAVQRGARGKLLVLESELRRYIASRPYKPTPRRPQPVNLAAWDREADRVLGKK